MAGIGLLRRWTAVRGMPAVVDFMIRPYVSRRLAAKDQVAGWRDL